VLTALANNPISAHTKGSKLVEAMKARYSQWTKKDTLPDYDMENARLGEETGGLTHTPTLPKLPQ